MRIGRNRFEEELQMLKRDGVYEPCDDRQHESNPSSVYLGSLLIIGGVTSVSLCAYTTIVKIFYSARCPTHYMRNDWYCALLVFLTFPVTVVAVYLHWLSMKLYKHA